MEEFDIIIVGAGLAGLSAAYEAGRKYKKVLVLEANDYAGGKVHTCKKNNVLYEKGAIFAFDKEIAPFDVNSGRLIREDHPIGIKIGNRLVFKPTVPDCIREISPGMRELYNLGHFFQSESPQVSHVGHDTLAALNSFFKVIQPGDLIDYVPVRRTDSLVSWDISHFEKGNRALVNGLIENSRTDIRTGCRVMALEQEKDGVNVKWIDNGLQCSARARWIILATPAPEARELLSGIKNRSTAFLDRVEYGAGIVVTCCLRNTILTPCSYIVSPDGSVNTFIFTHTIDDQDIRILTAYLVAEKAKAVRDHNDGELVDLVLEDLNMLGIGEVTHRNIDFSDVFRWPAVGAVISEETYAGFSQACLHPSERIILAGDYTWWKRNQMPYGIKAAIKSGREAVRVINKSVETLTPTGFQPKALAKNTVTELTDNGPIFKGIHEDGTVAYYGLILTAEPDVEIERYLVLTAEDGLWSYQQGSGVTSLDSALVMEGLLATGRHEKLLNHSGMRLVEKFFDESEGGFLTAPRGEERSQYWQGTDAPATAYCAWLLQQIDPERYADITNACAGYLKNKQLISGRWQGKWFPSDTIPVFYAVRFLVTMGTDYNDPCKRAGIWLRSRQNKNGSWGYGSIIETSAAVLALHFIEEENDIIQKGCDWIKRQRTDTGWTGEPILNYWLEDNNRRTCFHTIDKGAVTSAWATIALKTCS